MAETSEAVPVVTIPKDAIVCHCPHCGAYLFTLGCTGEMECDQCGGAFVVEETP